MTNLIVSLALFLSALVAIPALPCYAQTTAEITRGNCKACAESCTETINYCTTKGGALAQASVTNNLKDCITACKMTSEFLSRGSTLQAKAAILCIDACNAAAKSLDQFPTDNKMKVCANEVRKCAGNLNKVAHADGNSKAL